MKRLLTYLKQGLLAIPLFLFIINLYILKATMWICGPVKLGINSKKYFRNQWLKLHKMQQLLQNIISN